MLTGHDGSKMKYIPKAILEVGPSWWQYLEFLELSGGLSCKR